MFQGGEASMPITAINIKPDRKSINLNLKTINGLLLMVIAAAFCWYLLANVALASRGGVDLKELKLRLSALNAENISLEAKNNRLSSMNFLNENVAHLGMVPAGNIRYLYQNGTILAKQ